MRTKSFFLYCCALGLALAPFHAHAFAFSFEGQNKGSTNWVNVNLSGWQELDYIPTRAVLTGGPATNQIVTVTFDHTKGTTPGIENLTSFTPSSNVVIVAGPTLSAPVGVDTWGYTITVNLTDSNPAELRFFSRLGAGAHQFPGSSLALQSPTLQIHKPAPGAGHPDLAVTKVGPASAGIGETITYTVSYTNIPNALGTNAHGVQVTDTLPAWVSYVPGSASGGGTLVGNQLIWDLNDIPTGGSGTITYKVTVGNNAVVGQTFANLAQILCSQDDANYANNTSSVTTVVTGTVVTNHPPVAVNDSYSTDEDVVLNVAAPGVLTNDSDPDNNTLTATLASSPTHGTLSLKSDGSFTYTPNANYNGSDSFTYSVSDGVTNSAPATVAIIIRPVNDPPVAVNDTYTTAEDIALSVPAPGVLGNDSDIEGNTLTAILVSPPAHGSVNLSTNGSFVYTPATNFNGTDTFSYKANDGLTNSSPATVTITVTPVNDPPVAVNDSYSTDEDTPLVITAPGVLANDSDVDGNTLTAILVTAPTHGSLTLNTNGSFSYTPSTNYNGTDTFTYKANDGLTNSAVATVTLTIRPVNDPPVAVNDNYSVYENASLSIAAPGVLGNDSDVEGSPLTALLVTAPTHGTVTLNTNGSFVYTPATNYNGSDSFTYKANDGSTNSAPATVTIAIGAVNQPPSFTITSLHILNEDAGPQTETNCVTNISAGPPNEANQHLTFILTNNNPSLFAVQPAMSLDGTLTFTAATNAFGTADVTVILKDDGGTANGGNDTSTPGICTIQVNPVNDPPSFVKGPDQLVNQNAAQQIVTNWATSISPGPANESTQHVSFVLTNDNASLFSQQPQITPTGTLSYTPVAGTFGVAHLSIVLKDDGGTTNGGIDTSDPQSFTITVNGPPVANIITPTNGTVLVYPMLLTILCDAVDPDGTVTNLALYSGTNFTTNLPQPYTCTWTNLLPGTYQLHATATDNRGLTGQSTNVTVTVLDRPPLTTVQGMHLNPQTGLFEQTVNIANPSSAPFNGLRLLIQNLPANATVYNASGSTNGIPYIQYNTTIPVGQSVNLTIEYYTPDRVAPNPTLVAQLIWSAPPPNPNGVLTMLDGVKHLTNDTFLLDFNTSSNSTYYIQYSSDMRQWSTAPTSISGTGSHMQWLDNGPPTTDSSPCSRCSCFYRLLKLP